MHQRFSRQPRKNASVLTLALLSFTFFSPMAAMGQDIVAHSFLADTPDKRVETLLYLAAGVELSQLGYSSTRHGDIAQYYLFTYYVANGANIDIQYVLRSSADLQNELANISLSVALDHSADTSIGGAMRRLVATAGMETRSSPSARILDLFPESAAGQEALVAKLPIVELEDSITVIIDKQQEPESLAPTEFPIDEPEAPSGEAQSSPRFVASQVRGSARFSLAAETVATMYLGSAMDYFRYGLGASLGLGLAKRQPGWSLGLNAKASVARAFNDTYVVGGPLYLSTAGLELHLGSGAAYSHRSGLSLGGGAAFLTVSSPSSTSTKTVPFAELGAFINVPFGNRLRIGLALRGTAAFDTQLTIAGLSTALVLGWEQ